MSLKTETFAFPAVRTSIVFGLGVIQRLPEILRDLGVRRPLIVTDQGVLKAGVVDTVRAPLEAAGYTVPVFAEVPQDSSVAVVEQAVAILREQDCDGVIGIGGGSSLDTGKCVSVKAVDDRPLLELAGLGKVTREPLPLVAIPTTSGTGSEVSFWAVTRDDATNTKFSVGGELVFPRVALCDPELTKGLPPALTATTGMDALTHALESFTNRSHQPLSEALTLKAIELVAHNLAAAVQDGTNLEARYGMMLGSTLAGLGMNPTRLGAVHALAMPFGSGDLRIAHGAANAVMLPIVTEFNIPAAPEKYAQAARAMGVTGEYGSDLELAQAGLEKLREIVSQIGIATTMSELGLTRAHVPGVCEEAMKSGNIPANPREITQEQLEELCYKAL
ncbi:MAG: iron-containing alcohol dehydrogenase [Spirochaetota bacterium]